MRLDQPLQLEPRQRLAQRNFADPQLLGQRILTDRAVRRHPPRQDAVADQIDELIGQRLDDQRHARIMSIKLLSSSATRSEEHTSELQSLMRISYAVFCLTKKKYQHIIKPELLKTYKHQFVTT